MGHIRQREYLQGDLGAVEALFRSVPDDPAHILDRIGLQSRMEQLRTQLKELEQWGGKTAEAVLYFYGDPVVEEQGIDAKFSCDVLRAYQDLVSKQVASLIGPVGRTGPTKAEKETHLHITNVVHGSFGFELEEMTPSEAPLFTSGLAEAVESVSKLIEAAKESDEEFADVVANTNERVYDALRSFLSVVHKAGATFRLKSAHGEVAFDVEALAAATERASAVRSETADEPVEGRFLGVLLDSGRFEHRQKSTSEIVRGKVSPDADPRDFLSWTDKDCVAHLNVVTLTRGTKEQKRFTLQRITHTAGTEDTAVASQS